ncbi:MAG TPA: hypothetical protein VI383_00270 [Gemmatimonadales bacterium]|nr:hypothetical protein [Gemmatimonadales bacterium]
MAILVAILAATAAVLSYRFLEEWTRRTWVPAALRAAGWSTLGLLLMNPGCPGVQRPVPTTVLLDASLSMQAAGGRWSEALTLARARGTEVRFLGAEPGDTMPTGGRSRLAPAVAAALSAGRPVLLITDGELEDGSEIGADSPGGPEIRVLPRRPVEDIALTRVRGTTRLTAADSIRVEAEIVGTGGAGIGRRIIVEAREGARVWLRGEAILDSSRRGLVRLQGPVPAVPPGFHGLTIALTNAADPEPRTDARFLVVQVAASPGVVLLASPPSWESRFLYSALGDVAALPVRGYLETEPGGWRRSGSLEPASAGEVSSAIRSADLLVTLGTAALDLARSSRARARWAWLTSASAAPGDWYVGLSPQSPVGGALADLAVDSFPPGTARADLGAGPHDWVGLTARLGRRGAAHPILAGRDSAGVRRVVTGIEGLWRWAFRGGSSEQGYRALVASTVSWLLGGTAAALGRARLQRDVVQRGWPGVFEWAGGGNPTPLAVEWVGEPGARRDTLRFDGAGRAEVRLPPGLWSYRLEGGGGGGAGMLAVEEYSEEWIPRRVTVTERSGSVRASGSGRLLRGWFWLFGLAAAALAGEWAVRRRLGLR